MSLCGTVLNGLSATNDALLLQLFVQPLDGAGFLWYVSPLETLEIPLSAGDDGI